MESVEKEGQSKKYGLVNKTIDFFFSSDERKWLILIFILGVILRLLAANNVAPSVADEMVHGSHAIGILSSGAISEQNQCPVWFYLTDIAYKIFGVTSFSARFLSFFFGSLTILLIYLITKRVFNTKIALISSFLLAISSYYMRYTLMEMDEAMIFFVLLSFYYFIKELEKQKISYLSFVFIAIAVLVKPIALTFIPGFIFYFIFLLYKEKDKEKRRFLLKENYRRILIGSLIFLVFMSPVLVYNYLLYREKGITDIIFARFFGVSTEIYSGLLGGAGQKFSIKVLLQDGPKFLWDTFSNLDPLISLFGIFGIIIILLSKNRLGRLFVFLFSIPFIFLLGTQLLQTHFVVFMVPLCVSASIFIIKISDLSLLKKLNSKKVIFFFLILIFIVNLYIMWPYLNSKSAIFKARALAIDTIGGNDIVLSDSRIYRGRTVFMFHDKHYLESSYFSQLFEQMKNISGKEVPIQFYFVECIPDDCGWGTIRNQPELNQSTENFFEFVKNSSEKISTIYSGGMDEGEKKNGKPYFNIYRATFYAKPQVFSMVDSTHEWFYYPVMWKGERYDKYALDTQFKSLLHNFAYIILWIAIIIAILSPIFLFYELKGNRNV